MASTLFLSLLCVLFALCTPRGGCATEISTFTQQAEQTIASILSIPAEEQTFHNTVAPWVHLTDQFQDYLAEIDRLSNDDLEVLRQFSRSFSELPSFTSHLWQGALKVAHSSNIHPFEKFIAEQLINPHTPPIFYYDL